MPNASNEPKDRGAGHIWLTLFEESATPESKIPDFHPAIAASGLYWVTVIPDGALVMSADGRRVSREISGLEVIGGYLAPGSRRGQSHPIHAHWS